MVNRKEPRRRNFNHGIMRFTDWKQTAIDLMVNDDKLTKLLRYDTPDVLQRTSLSTDERLELVNKRIFGFRYNPQPVNETGSFIGMGLSNFVPQEGFRQFSDDYIMGYLYLYILVDTEIMITDTGYRQDLILNRIYEIFQECRGFGLGELRLETCLELWQHNNKFGGYSAGFRIVEMK
ncbi:hypothetical protein [Enterococcus mundtii]|uniref:hypothetical protein n=1 Tax=Enterococcus mundtii TaxID=53346 RepID=UPI001A96A9F5|nr:hypothetical protein [Enterococcus mundtii]MBO1087248.1 hypothetical protein [Enterococcus mundtii]